MPANFSICFFNKNGSHWGTNTFWSKYDFGWWISCFPLLYFLLHSWSNKDRENFLLEWVMCFLSWEINHITHGCVPWMKSFVGLFWKIFKDFILYVYFQQSLHFFDVCHTLFYVTYISIFGTLDFCQFFAMCQSPK